MDKEFRTNQDGKERLDESKQDRSFEHSEGETKRAKQDESDWPSIGAQDSRYSSES